MYITRYNIAPTLSGTASERGERGGALASRNANWSKRPGGAFPKNSVIGRSSLSSLALASAGGGRSSSLASAAAPADERTRNSLAYRSIYWPEASGPFYVYRLFALA